MRKELERAGLALLCMIWLYMCDLAGRAAVRQTHGASKSARLHVRCTYAILKSGRAEFMSVRSGIRDDRIELRASREQKRLLAAAAAYERLDLTTFVMRTALPAAEEIVARNERIQLTGRDTARILELLEHPPAPPPALRAAAKRRRKRR